MASSDWARIADQGGLAVLLIRHGRTSLNAQRRFCGGRSDPSLDAEGRAQVQSMGARWAGALDLVFCSPQRRARETAAVLGEAEQIEGLRELDQGALEGREIEPSLAEHAEFFAAWKRDPSDVSVPGGGESMGQLADRAHAALSEIAAGAHVGEGRVIAVVSHQMTQAAFLCAALGEPLREWPRFQLGNARANLVAWDGQRWALVARGL